MSLVEAGGRIDGSVSYVIPDHDFAHQFEDGRVGAQGTIKKKIPEKNLTNLWWESQAAIMFLTLAKLMICYLFESS